MELYPALDVNFMRLKPTPEFEKAIYSLEFDGVQVGTAVAINPRIALSAGHHFLATSDDVGAFGLHHPTTGVRAEVIYAQKEAHRDLLVMWLAADVDYVRIRGIQPPEGLRVITCWLNMAKPHDLIVSPGFISLSQTKLCQVRGTVSCKGSSGGPVIDHHGDMLLGIHLSSNDNYGTTRVSEFIPSREIIQILGAQGTDPTVPWKEEDGVGEEDGEEVAELAGNSAKSQVRTGPVKAGGGKTVVRAPKKKPEAAPSIRAALPTRAAGRKSTRDDADGELANLRSSSKKTK